MEYLAVFIALSATFVGVFGETRQKEARGWRRITKWGYCALSLAVLGSTLSLIKIWSINTLQKARRFEANEILAQSAEGIQKAVYWNYADENMVGLPRASNQLEEELNLIGERIGRILTLYQDVLDTPTRKSALSIQLMTTEQRKDVENSQLARGYMRSLDDQIHSLMRSIGRPLDDKNPTYRLENFSFDFEHPEPDHSIH